LQKVRVPDFMGLDGVNVHICQLVAVGKHQITAAVGNILLCLPDECRAPRPGPGVVPRGETALK